MTKDIAQWGPEVWVSGALPSFQGLGSTSSAKHPGICPPCPCPPAAFGPGTPAGQGWCWPRVIWGSHQASQFYSLFQGLPASSWPRVGAPQARTMSDSFHSLGCPSAWPRGLAGGLGSPYGWTPLHSLLWSGLSSTRRRPEGKRNPQEDGVRKPSRSGSAHARDLEGRPRADAEMQGPQSCTRMPAGPWAGQRVGAPADGEGAACRARAFLPPHTVQFALGCCAAW